MGFTFDTIRAELRDAGDGLFRETAWIEESWKHPEDFAAALMEYHSQLDPEPFKSKPRDGYDFYHDLVLRHVGTERVALMWLENGTVRKLTYAQLHAQCTQRRAEWTAREVQKGQPLCVLANMGPELIVPLLTGLRMGLVVTLLPPVGVDFLARRFRLLGNPWVATASRYVPLLRSLNLTRAPLIERTDSSSVEPTSADATSHTYPPDAVALNVFSPVQDPPDEPVEVKAGPLYHAVLRDGLLLLGLNPGHLVAEAEQMHLQMQPTLLLTTMLRGAVLLHLNSGDFERDVRRDDPLVSLPPIHVLFANANLRTTMLNAPVRPIFGSLQLWVTNPQEIPNPSAWSDWTARWSLQSVPAISLMYDSACGGGLMFSLRHFGTPSGYLMPVPGRPFELLQPDDSGQPARTNYGLFKPSPKSITLLLTHIEGGYLYAGTRTPTNEGQATSKEEIEQAVQDLSFVRGASLVQEPGDRGPSTLMLFTGPETIGWAKNYMRRRQLLAEQAIRQKLSPGHVPARILICSAVPRLTSGGRIDHHWCAQMLQSGEIFRRNGNPIFLLLDRLLLTMLPAIDRKLK